MPLRLRIGSLEAAAAFVDQVGIAVAWGKADLVLPSLWQEIAGPDADWALRDEAGKPVGLSPEFERLWRWKDDLPEQRLACAGRHFSDAALLIAPRLVGAAYALTGRSGTVEDFREEELEALEGEVAEAVFENEPLTGRELRRVLATNERKAVDRAVRRLQRRLVLTNAGAVEQAQGWRAIRQDLFARRWAKWLHRLPAEEAPRRGAAPAGPGGTGRPPGA